MATAVDGWEGSPGGFLIRHSQSANREPRMVFSGAPWVRRLAVDPGVAGQRQATRPAHDHPAGRPISVEPGGAAAQCTSRHMTPAVGTIAPNTSLRAPLGVRPFNREADFIVLLPTEEELGTSTSGPLRRVYLQLS
jgi:hypothetical protein